ncbi:MAG: hypothetical protein WCE30_17310 [Mycobacterium sp.]
MVALAGALTTALAAWRCLGGATPKIVVRLGDWWLCAAFDGVSGLALATAAPLARAAPRLTVMAPALSQAQAECSAAMAASPNFNEFVGRLFIGFVNIAFRVDPNNRGSWNQQEIHSRLGV